jgi:hypothetical protein
MRPRSGRAAWGEGGGQLPDASAWLPSTAVTPLGTRPVTDDSATNGKTVWHRVVGSVLLPDRIPRPPPARQKEKARHLVHTLGNQVPGLASDEQAWLTVLHYTVRPYGRLRQLRIIARAVATWKCPRGPSMRGRSLNSGRGTEPRARPPPGTSRTRARYHLFRARKREHNPMTWWWLSETVWFADDRQPETLTPEGMAARL